MTPDAQALDDIDLAHAAAIEAFLASEPGQYLRAYWVAKYDLIVKKAAKANSETHWRKQQGWIQGFLDAVELPDKLVARAKAEVERREKERSEGLEAPLEG